MCHQDIGDNCFILDLSCVQPFGRIGNNVILGAQVVVSHHSVIDSNVTLAEGTLVGISAAVKRDTEPRGIYIGDPAQRRRMRSDRCEFL